MNLLISVLLLTSSISNAADCAKKYTEIQKITFNPGCHEHTLHVTFSADLLHLGHNINPGHVWDETTFHLNTLQANKGWFDENSGTELSKMPIKKQKEVSSNIAHLVMESAVLLIEVKELLKGSNVDNMDCALTVLDEFAGFSLETLEKSGALPKEENQTQEEEFNDDLLNILNFRSRAADQVQISI